jgi:hypothetical protein
MRCGEIFADSDRGVRTAVAPQIVSCCRNGNQPVSLRELHVDEGKSSVAGIDACDERVVRHGLFSSQILKDSCWNARKNSRVGNGSGQF